MLWANGVGKPLMVSVGKCVPDFQLWMSRTCLSHHHSRGIHRNSALGCQRWGLQSEALYSKNTWWMRALIFIPTEKGNFLVIRVAFLVPESYPYISYGKTSLEATGREPRAQAPRKQPGFCCLCARFGFFPCWLGICMADSIPRSWTIFKAYPATSVTLMQCLISLFTLGTREIGSMPGPTLRSYGRGGA